MKFQLTTEFIELNSLLKLLQIVPSGGMAKVIIQEGEVYVNGEQEFRVRRKCRIGDVISVFDHTIEIHE